MRGVYIPVTLRNTADAKAAVRAVALAEAQLKVARAANPSVATAEAQLKMAQGLVLAAEEQLAKARTGASPDAERTTERHGRAKQVCSTAAFCFSLQLHTCFSLQLHTCFSLQLHTCFSLQLHLALSVPHLHGIRRSALQVLSRKHLCLPLHPATLCHALPT